MTIETVDDLISAFGKRETVAKVAGVRGSAVSNWKVRGYVPPRAWVPLVNAAKAMGIPGISLEVLAQIGAAQQGRAA